MLYLTFLVTKRLVIQEEVLGVYDWRRRHDKDIRDWRERRVSGPDYSFYSKSSF